MTAEVSVKGAGLDVKKYGKVCSELCDRDAIAKCNKKMGGKSVHN